MKNITIKMIGFGFLPTLTIDNKVVKTKKNKFGGRECFVQTDKNTVEIGVYKYQEINGKLWWLMYFLFFVISLGGIFDIPFGKNIVSLTSKFVVTVGENTNIKIYLNENAMRNGKSNNAIKIECTDEVETVQNTIFVDERAKKRIKIYRILKVLTWVAAIVTLIALMITGVL